MIFNNLFAGGEANAIAGVLLFGMQALKAVKDTLPMLLRNANAVVFYGD
jgi:hypothetical protein